MCVPGCTETVSARLSRRKFLAAAVTAAATATSCDVIINPHQAPTDRPRRRPRPGFNQVVDLTHTLMPEFPTYFGEPLLSINVLNTFAEDGINMKEWTLAEHVGTHMDAPFHFAPDPAYSADAIPVEDLVLPLAIIDIRAKAEEDADAQVTPDDITAWEAEHSPLPEGACVAMLSGWDAHVNSDMFRNADDEGIMHFPGFHLEAVQLMLEERDVKAIAVDTLSLDFGPSSDFAVHYAWLPTNRWGMENVANLGMLPPVGATIVAGGPKIQGATGGPSRVIALV